jgi:hypothetical protein
MIMGHYRIIAAHFLGVIVVDALLVGLVHAECSVMVRRETAQARGLRGSLEAAPILADDPDEFSVEVINTGERSLDFDEISTVFYSKGRPVTASTIVMLATGERQYLWHGGPIEPPSVEDAVGKWTLDRKMGSVWTLQALNAAPPFSTLGDRKAEISLVYKKRVVQGPCVLQLGR